MLLGVIGLVGLFQAMVGHGFLNYFVAKELQKQNWKGPRSPGKKYWAYSTYEYVEK